MTILFCSINYNDGSKGLESIQLEDTFNDNKIIKSFNTGDPLIDWYEYYRWIYNDGLGKYIMITYSSSIDHWFMDNGEYIEQYFTMDDDGEVHFVDHKDLSFKELDTTPKCVIRKGMTTFKELKDYYKDYISKLSLNQRLERNGIERYLWKTKNTSFGDRKVYKLKFGDKEIIAPPHQNCIEVVKKEFGITI